MSNQGLQKGPLVASRKAEKQCGGREESRFYEALYNLGSCLLKKSLKITTRISGSTDV